MLSREFGTGKKGSKASAVANRDRNTPSRRYGMGDKDRRFRRHSPAILTDNDLGLTFLPVGLTSSSALLLLLLVMNFPQHHHVIELNLPPASFPGCIVAPSDLMTLRVDKDHSIHWRLGDNVFHEVEGDNLRSLLEEKEKEYPRLTMVLNIDRQAKYRMFVDLIDAVNLAGVRRYVVRPIAAGDRPVFISFSPRM